MATSDADATLPFNLIGKQAFLPALLVHIRGLSTVQSLPLDPVIFQSILLCLIAGEKHLILRTPEEDIGITVKIVVWTLSCVFDIPTRKLRIRAPSAGSGPPPSSPSASTSSRPSKFKSAASDPAAFLRALFLHGASSSLNSNETSQDEYDGESARHQHHHRQYSKRTQHRTRHAHEPEYTRSHSVPNNLVNITYTAHGSAVTPAIPRATSPESLLMGSSIAQQQQQQHSHRDNNTTSTAPLPILRPQPIYPTLSSGSHIPHSYTDPLPRPRSTHSKIRTHRRTPSGVSSTAGASQASKGEGGPPQFPSAVVLSGLEDASEGVQRAFGRVLSDKRVMLGGRGEEGGGDAEEMRALPEGFFVVYVCPWSATERPGVHKSLLDKFAMSTNVTIPPNIRREFHLLPFSPVLKPLSPQLYNYQQQQSTSSALPSPKMLFFSHSNPGTPSPGQAHALPPQSSYTPPPVPPIALPGSTVSMQRRASSHSSHSFRSHAYTHYSQTQTHRHSHSHYSHSTLHPPAPAAFFPYPPLPSSFLKTLHAIAVQHTRIAPALKLYMADIFSATRHHPRLEGTLLGRAALKDAEALVRAGRVVGADLTGMELLRPEVGVGAEDTSGLEEGHDEHGHENEDEDEDEGEEDYSSALDISIHNEPFISIRAPSVASSATPTATARSIGILDVSEVNIARIVPRVISHRVRVRSAPDEEVLASALFGATFQPPVPQAGVGKVDGDGSGADLKGEEKKERVVSVKAVLVQILAEV